MALTCNVKLINTTARAIKRVSEREDMVSKDWNEFSIERRYQIISKKASYIQKSIGTQGFNVNDITDMNYTSEISIESYEFYLVFLWFCLFLLGILDFLLF
jgi:hypothetical protein